MHGSIPRLDVAAPCSSFRVSEFLARLESCVVLALSRTSPRCRSRTMRSCLVAKHVQTGFLRSIGRMLGDCVTRDSYRTRLVRHACALEGLPSHLPWPSLQGLLPVLWPSSETSLVRSNFQLLWVQSWLNTRDSRHLVALPSSLRLSLPNSLLKQWQSPRQQRLRLEIAAIVKSIR